MRFYLDEDLSPEIARIARNLGLDVMSANELGNEGLPDPDQLDFAAREGRCLVTANYRDFQAQTDRFAAEGRAHAGVVCVPPTWDRRNFARIARSLVTYAELRGNASNEWLCDFLR